MKKRVMKIGENIHREDGVAQAIRIMDNLVNKEISCIK